MGGSPEQQHNHGISMGSGTAPRGYDNHGALSPETYEERKGED